MKLKFFDPFAMISNLSPDVEPENKTLFEAFWCVLFQVGRKHNQVTIPFNEVYGHLFPKWLLHLHPLKVELLLSPLYAISQVLKASSPLLWRSTQVDHMVEVCLALACLRDVLVDLLQHLIVSQSVFLLQQLLIVRKFALISFQLWELAGGVLALCNVCHQGGNNHSCRCSPFSHLTIEDACGVGGNIFQLIHHGVKRELAGRLLIHDWHPGIAELITKLLQLFVHSRKSDQVFIVVQVHRVLDVLAVLWVFSVGVPVVPDDSLLLVRGVAVLATLLHLVFEALDKAVLKPVDIRLSGSRELHVLVHLICKTRSERLSVKEDYRLLAHVCPEAFLCSHLL